jgi:hypothetical protein
MDTAALGTRPYLICGRRTEDGGMLSEARWGMLRALIERCRPRGKTPHRDLRRTIEAIVWRHENGAKWRSIPAELGPWWMAAQTFIRWVRLGVWERLLGMAQESMQTCGGRIPGPPLR